ncbi:MAG: PilZ domain-containing protein [Candidatus Electrothrix sp.]
MEEENKRRFSRVNIQWAVRLDFGAMEYKRFVDNVSLGGLYVEGDFQQLMGDVCIISLKPSGLLAEEPVHAVGFITRISERGVAVEFISMKLDSFFFLQATLFCKAVDPALLGREFISNNIFEIEDDLILFEPFPIDFRTMKQMQRLLLRPNCPGRSS